MEKFVMAAISLVLFSTLVCLAALAWKRRSRHQESMFSPPLEALDYFGELISKSDCFYVATTFSQNHLERISAFGLGARGKAQLFLFSEGVLIVRTGERPLAIDGDAMLSVSQNQVAIDKVVEGNGLITFNWIHEGAELSTHLRVTNQQVKDSVLKAASVYGVKESEE